MKLDPSIERTYVIPKSALCNSWLHGHVCFHRYVYFHKTQGKTLTLNGLFKIKPVISQVHHRRRNARHDRGR